MTKRSDTPSLPSWKDGDWCFHEYTLKQIGVKNGKVQEASCGMFRVSGNDLSEECRPLTLRNANLSQDAQHWSDKLHKEGHAGLNHPNIHRKMVELWCAACDTDTKGAAEAIGDFASKVLKASTEPVEIDGVPLIRRRYG